MLSALVTWAYRLWLCTEWEALHPHSEVDYCSVQQSEYFVKWRWCWDKFNHVLMELWPHLYCGAKIGGVVDTCTATVVTSFKIMQSQQSTVCAYVPNFKMHYYYTLPHLYACVELHLYACSENPSQVKCIIFLHIILIWITSYLLYSPVIFCYLADVPVNDQHYLQE